MLCLCTFQHLQERFSGVTLEVMMCLMMFYIV
jgi:hypothetical protein